MKHTSQWALNSRICLAILAVLGLTVASSAAPLGMGDSGAVGNRFGWDAATLRSVDLTALSATGYSFTAFENVAIDSVFQRLTNLGSDTESLKVQLHADNGSGLPGSVLASTTVNFSGTKTVQASFGSSVNLSAGNVYHVTIANDDVGSDVPFRMFHSRFNQSVRPSDHRDDAAMGVLQANAAGDFSVVARDPYFFATNGGNPVNGIGQSISLRSANNNIRSFSSSSQLEGQLFSITEHEITTGTSFEVDSISLGLTTFGSPAQDFFVRLRSTDGTILASGSVDTTTLPTSGSPFDSSPTIINFDSSVVLAQGTDYLITTDFNGVTTGGTDFVRIQSTLSGFSADPGEEEGGYLGVEGYVVRPGTDWSDASGFGRNEFDLVFALNGMVVPEPASLGLIGICGLLMARSRRRA